MAGTMKDLYTRAYVAFQKQGNSELEAMNRAQKFVAFHKKQKKSKKLFEDSKPSGAASVRG